MNLMSICFIVIVCYKATHNILSHSESLMMWALQLAPSRPLCLIFSLHATCLLDAIRCNAALTMLRLCFQFILHARLQDTDMQIYMVLGVGFVFLQMCSIKVNMHWKKKTLGYKLCVFCQLGEAVQKKKPSAKPSS